MNNPLVTIGIATHECLRLKYLQEAVDSALNQTYENVELLIHQDSTATGLDQGIFKWCEEAVSKNSKIRFIYSKKNQGLSGSFNRLAENAKGDYINIMADDDRLLSDYVEKMMKKSKNYPDVIFSNHYVIDSTGARSSELTDGFLKRYKRDLMEEGFLKDPLFWIWQNSIPICSSLIKTVKIKENPFNERLNTPEIEFFLRLANLSGSFFFVPDYLAEYRCHVLSNTSDAGMWYDKLFWALKDIPTPDQYLNLKAKFVGNLSVAIAHKLLLDGKADDARKFTENEYYEAMGKFEMKRMFLQKLCFCIPGQGASFFYKFLFSIKQLFKLRVK